MKEIIISNHAKEQFFDRGTNEEEVRVAIETGEQVPAKKDRIAFRKNFVFNSVWKGEHYDIKQVMPIVVEEMNKYIVVTVYVFYFGGER